jgi:hypothetical protein
MWHVDATARLQDEPAAPGQFLAAHQAHEAGPVVVGKLSLLGQHDVAGAIGDLYPTHHR